MKSVISNEFLELFSMKCISSMFKNDFPIPDPQGIKTEKKGSGN